MIFGIWSTRSTQVNGNTMLRCTASGDPAPDIQFRKDSNREPFSQGAQSDTRIFIDQRKNGRITVATLKISDVLRTDDGKKILCSYEASLV